MSDYPEQREADRLSKQQWPGENRIDAIGQNGNTGEHYDILTLAEQHTQDNLLKIKIDNLESDNSSLKRKLRLKTSECSRQKRMAAEERASNSRKRIAQELLIHGGLSNREVANILCLDYEYICVIKTHINKKDKKG